MLVTVRIVDEEKAQMAETSLEMLISDGNIHSYYGRAAAFLHYSLVKQWYMHKNGGTLGNNTVNMQKRDHLFILKVIFWELSNFLQLDKLKTIVPKTQSAHYHGISKPPVMAILRCEY